MTQDELTPNTAPIVAHELGADGAGAFDVGAACTAFLSGAGAGRRPDREPAAPSACCWSAPTSSPASPTTTTSAPRRCSPTPPARSCSAPRRRRPRRDRPDRARRRRLARPRRSSPTHDERKLSDGRPRGVPPRGRADERGHARRRSTRAGLTLEDIDLFVYHQANARITRALGERLGLPAERVVDCIETLGNASAATLPVALAAAERDGRLRPGARVLLSAFGAGFTWGGGVIEWGGAAVPEPAADGCALVTGASRGIGAAIARGAGRRRLAGGRQLPHRPRRAPRRSWPRSRRPAAAPSRWPADVADPARPTSCSTQLEAHFELPGAGAGQQRRDQPRRPHAVARRRGVGRR